MLFHLRVKFLDKQHAPGGRRLPFDSFEWPERGWGRMRRGEMRDR